MDISKIVLGKEMFYKYGAPSPEDPIDETSWAAGINQYAKQLSEAGFEVVVIGFDYRYKDAAQEARHLFKIYSNQNLFKNLTYPTHQDQSNLANDLYASLLSVDKWFLIAQQEKFPSRTGFNKTH